MPPQRTSKLQEKSSSIKREHPALEISSLWWVISALLDLDPDDPKNADPDPQHGNKV